MLVEGENTKDSTVYERYGPESPFISNEDKKYIHNAFILKIQLDSLKWEDNEPGDIHEKMRILAPQEYWNELKCQNQ